MRQLKNYKKYLIWDITTIEIAEYTGKQPAHVKRDAEKMLRELSINSDISIFGESF